MAGGENLKAADDHIDLVKKGNEAFKAADLKKALEFYRNAEIQLPESPELEYNIAGALYRQGDYEQATESYMKALNTVDIKQEGATHYNLGNTYFRAGDYQKAIKSYEESLKISPEDMEAKYNLELTRKKLKDEMNQEQDQDQQEQEEKQDQDQEQQDQEQQDQGDQENEQEDQPQDQSQQEQSEDQDKQEQQEPQPQENKQISREDAERILNALRDDEQDIQKKLKKRIVGGDYRGRDW